MDSGMTDGLDCKFYPTTTMWRGAEKWKGEK